MGPLANRLRDQRSASPWILLLCVISVSMGLLSFVLFGLLSLSAAQISLLAPLIISIVTLIVGMLAIKLHQRSNEIYELFNGALNVVDASLIIFDKNDTVVQYNSAAAKALKANGIALKRGLHINVLLKQQADFELKTELERDIWIRSALQRRERSLEHATIENIYTASTDSHSQASLHRLTSGHTVDFRTDITAVKRSELAVIQREAELKKARVEAETSAKAKSEFLANMSHEIRTPMNGVVGMIELLLGSGLNEDQMVYARTVSNSGLALLTIVNDILDFSKIEADKLELDKSEFNLLAAVEDVGTLLSTKAHQKNVELVVDFSADLPQTYVGDEGRIRQILNNLTGNAIKFTEKGHVLLTVEGSVTRGKAHLIFSIRDTGIGIPASKLSSIFSVFEQVDSASNRRFEGTGLGLAISSRLVKLMGSEIEVKSDIGAGSTFSFALRLPVAESEQTAGTTLSWQPDCCSVLLVDDLQASRDVLKRQLDSLGLQTDTVSNAEQAAQKLQQAQTPYSLIILDYPSGEESEQNFSTLLMHDSRWSEIPVLLLSSLDQTVLRKKLEHTPYTHWLSKPARKEQLENTVFNLLNPHLSQPTKELESEAQDGFSSDQSRNLNIQSGTNQILGSLIEDIRILIVEDNEVNQLVVTSMLDGFCCEVAGNGRIGVEKFQSYCPDLVLMDVSMPEMNGMDATRAIRQLEQELHLPHCPIIALTANAMQGDKEKCLAAGMDDFISKPVLMDELNRQLLNWIGIDSNGQLKAA